MCKIFRKIGLYTILLTMCLIIRTNVSSAYVLWGPHALELMVKNLGTVGSLHIKQVMLQRSSEPPRVFIHIPEDLYYQFPNRFRSDMQTEAIRKIVIEEDGKILTVIDDTIIENDDKSMEWYRDLLLLRDRQMIHSRLLRRGVDVSVTSLGRFKEKPVIVIGSRFPDDTISNLMIDKKTFLPIRWLIVERGDLFADFTDHLEIFYSDWRKIKKIWYPMHISFQLNGELIREIMVSEIKIDPQISSDFMNIKHLSSLYMMEEPINDFNDDSDDMSEVEKTIEEFKKIFE